MIIQKAELFKGLSPEIMNEISKIMIEESCEPGTFVFQAGAPAKHFYILGEGRVRLFIGTKAEITYTVNSPGEAFGWTGLVDRPAYVATAECVAPSKITKIENEKLAKVFENDAASGMLFFKRLAGIVVQRLINNYEAFLSEGSLKEVTPSYG
ncbi:MAG: cyclic nucleotide-binding domain-containing protein [Desulfomonile tiedjei]|nr:cyclic nucleotide-binding domain-containing protein [Desulfomonile tiedjei]